MHFVFCYKCTFSGDPSLISLTVEQLRTKFICQLHFEVSAFKTVEKNQLHLYSLSLHHQKIISPTTASHLKVLTPQKTYLKTQTKTAPIQLSPSATTDVDVVISTTSPQQWLADLIDMPLSPLAENKRRVRKRLCEPDEKHDTPIKKN